MRLLTDARACPKVSSPSTNQQHCSLDQCILFYIEHNKTQAQRSVYMQVNPHKDGFTAGLFAVCCPHKSVNSRSINPIYAHTRSSSATLRVLLISSSCSLILFFIRASNARARIPPSGKLAILPALLPSPLDSLFFRNSSCPPPTKGDSPSFLRRGTRVPRCKESEGGRLPTHQSTVHVCCPKYYKGM